MRPIPVCWWVVVSRVYQVKGLINLNDSCDRDLSMYVTKSRIARVYIQSIHTSISSEIFWEKQSTKSCTVLVSASS